jgi:hypothetical protein
LSSRDSANACRISLWCVALPLVWLLALSGCKTTEPAGDAPVRSLAAEGPRDFRGCVDAIAGDPQYEPLRDKLYLGTGGEYHRSYLHNKAKPDDSDIELLKAVHGDVQNCRKIALAETLPPNERQALAEFHAADDKIWADVLAGRLTWGKFNESRRIIAMRQQAKLNVASTGPKIEPLTPAKFDFNSIDYGNKVLPQFSRSPGERGLRLIDDFPSRKSYCDRMSNTAYCSARR